MLLSGIVFDFYIPVIIFIKIVDGLFHLLLNPVPLPGAFDPVAAYQEQKLFQKEGEQILIGGNDAYIGMCYNCWQAGKLD